MSAVSLVEFDAWCKEYLDANFRPEHKLQPDILSTAEKIIKDGPSGTVVVRVGVDMSASVVSSRVPLIQDIGMKPIGPKAYDISSSAPKSVLVTLYQSHFSKLPSLSITNMDVKAVVHFLSIKKGASHFQSDLQRVDKVIQRATKITFDDIQRNERIKVIAGPCKDLTGVVYNFDPAKKDKLIKIKGEDNQTYKVDINNIERDMTLYLGTSGQPDGKGGFKRETITGVTLGYNADFIARGIFEDWLAYYGGVPGYEKYGQDGEGSGAYVSLAYMLGHELMHYRYAHTASDVHSSLISLMMPTYLKDYENRLSRNFYMSVAQGRAYELSEIQNNTYMSDILDVPAVNGALGPQIKNGMGIWAFGYLTLTKIEKNKIKPETPELLNVLKAALKSSVHAKIASSDEAPAKKRRSKKSVSESMASIPPELLQDPNALQQMIDDITKKLEQDVDVWDLTFEWTRENIRGVKQLRSAKEHTGKVKHPVDGKELELDSYIVAKWQLNPMVLCEAARVYCAVMGLFNEETIKEQEEKTPVHEIQRTDDDRDFKDDDLEPDEGEPPPPPPPGKKPPKEKHGYQPGQIVRVNKGVDIPGRAANSSRDGIVVDATNNPDRTQNVTILIDDGEVMKAIRHKHPVNDPNPVQGVFNSGDITVSPNRPLPPKKKEGAEGRNIEHEYEQGQIVKNKNGDIGVIVGVSYDKDDNVTLKVNKDPEVVKEYMLKEEYEMWTKPWPESFKSRLNS